MATKTAVIMALGIAALAIPLEAAVEGEGRSKKFAFSVSDTSALVSTTSPVFVPVPDMRVDTAFGEGPVLIHFCGTPQISGGTGIFVKAQVDGNDVLPPGNQFPGGIQFHLDPASLPRCFTWVATDLDEGTHTFEILWLKFDGGTGFLQDRILIVEGGDDDDDDDDDD